MLTLLPLVLKVHELKQPCLLNTELSLLYYFRPISCYSGAKAAVLTEDVKLAENLTVCGYQDDVCYGKVVLTISNTSTTSKAVLQVKKGCGKRLVLEAMYKGKATFDSARQCFVTNIVENNKVVNNFFKDNSTEPILSDRSETGRSTSTQEELCICEGSRCNAGIRQGGTVCGSVILWACWGYARIRYKI